MNRAVGGHWLAWEETAGTQCRGSCLRVPASGAALSITALVAGVESISNDGHRTEQDNNGGCSEVLSSGPLITSPWSDVSDCGTSWSRSERAALWLFSPAVAACRRRLRNGVEAG